jgi:hypothetical protein
MFNLLTLFDSSATKEKQMTKSAQYILNVISREHYDEIRFLIAKNQIDFTAYKDLYILNYVTTEFLRK